MAVDFPGLHCDIIFEILSRASPETLNVCISVSKDWRDVIYEPRFAAAYRKRYNELFHPYFKREILEVATGFFSEQNQLGGSGFYHGTFGAVYWGTLPHGEQIAVKKLRRDITSVGFADDVEPLLNHMPKHKNLIDLRGCCVEGDQKMIVYKYLPNRSLDCFLFDREKSGLLDWKTRFGIIEGVARGLAYLHEEFPDGIILGNIKASNILLDGKLNPKISDFVMARLFKENDYHVKRTLSSLAPEYCMDAGISVKMDVFCFGILILEIVSGRKHIDFSLDEDKTHLLEYARELAEAEELLELVDPSLDEYNIEEATLYILLGLLCCQTSVVDRPDIKEVQFMLSRDSSSSAGRSNA